jgi:hypothetical protein
MLFSSQIPLAFLSNVEKKLIETRKSLPKVVPAPLWLPFTKKSSPPYPAPRQWNTRGSEYFLATGWNADCAGAPLGKSALK